MNFLFSVFLEFYNQFFFIIFILLLKKKKKKSSRIVSLLSCGCPVLVAGVHVLMGLNCDQMEPPHEEQHCDAPIPGCLVDNLSTCGIHVSHIMRPINE